MGGAAKLLKLREQRLISSSDLFLRQVRNSSPRMAVFNGAIQLMGQEELAVTLIRHFSCHLDFLCAFRAFSEGRNMRESRYPSRGGRISIDLRDQSRNSHFFRQHGVQFISVSEDFFQGSSECAEETRAGHMSNAARRLALQ